MATSTDAQGQVFIGPGLSPFKRVMTVVGVLIVTTMVVLIAIREGAPATGSLIVAIVFIFGFVIYLRIVAPIPFTIELKPDTLVKRGRDGEVIELRWEQLTRIKEEFFPNGKRIGIIVYRNPTTPQEKTKAWAVYRDDVPDIDTLAKTLQAAIPPTCQWQSETVHE